MERLRDSKKKLRDFEEKMDEELVSAYLSLYFIIAKFIKIEAI